MLEQRRDSATNNNANSTINFKNYSDDHLDKPNSAKSTAISSASEQDLRVPCYCEENVWRLAYRRLFSRTNDNNAEDDADKENEQYYVVFISNDELCCPMLNQLASKNAHEPCFWDYHVILMQSSNGVRTTGKTGNGVATQVLDMDSRLSYPCSLDDYLNGTFQLDFVDGIAKKKYSPKFRVVRAELFLQNFYSDRMHMYQDGEWSASPPKYDCILTDGRMMKVNTKGNMSNLNDYITMSSEQGKESSFMGEVFTLKDLRSKFVA